MADRFQEILKGRPVILGHRGCPGQAQENSLESFHLALAAGADGIELDVHGTSDGELIVFHDESLSDGPFIREHTYAAVKKAAQERNIVLHTLEQVFYDLTGKGIINIELKQTGIEEQTLTLARLLLPAETFLFSSFIPEAVAECRKLAADVPAIWIQCGAEDLQGLLDTIRRISAAGVAFEHTAINDSVALFFREHKVPLFTWTVNDIEEAKRMESLGVAGIITDRPDELMKYFGKQNKSMRIGLATCRELAQLIPGDQLLRSELIARGHDARPVIWDAGEDIKQFDCLVIRNTWDYSLRIIEFLKWINHIAASGVKLFNPPQVIRWNSSKLYLRELEANGVAIPETEWIAAGVALNLTSVLKSHHWTRAVVKPVISAGGRSTYLFNESQAAEIESKLRKEITCDLMVQEFMPEVIHPGEYSSIFFNGNDSHLILKTPKTNDFRVQKRHGGSYQLIHPPGDIINQASYILSRIPFSTPPLYARVDAVLRDNRLILCELELLEPELFLEYDPESVPRFADELILSASVR